jgi:diketogulonate reductase-like aldo/keto reductase
LDVRFSAFDVFSLVKTVTLPGGEQIPALGQGTWRLGEKKSARNDEVAALRLGIDLGMTLIDTAEMYGDGGAEEVVADAVAGQRNQVFVVTKAYPHNASRTKLPKACERSLKRLRADVVDLYLLHWREKSPPLEETVEAFEKLRAAEKIRHWGVSNFDVADMKELFSINDGSNCTANQVLYNLNHREIEFSLLPFLHQQSTTNHHQPFVMAYAPVGHGRGLLSNTMLKQIAKRHDATPAQIALAWLLRQDNVIAIPKAAKAEHVRDNARSADIELTRDDLSELDREFPAPKSKKPLPML